jgi:hypothetical protein
VPYANTVKDYRLNHKVIATGLWSRTGKVIYAPDYWLSELPDFPLDGELYIAPRTFQDLTSIVSTKDGSRDPDWSDITYQVFDSPPFLKMFVDRKVKVRDYDFEIKGAMDWYYEQSNLPRSTSIRWNFEMVQDWLSRNIHHNIAKQLLQQKLPFNHHEALEMIDTCLNEWLKKGAEGVILRKAESFWIPERSHLILKHKPWLEVGVIRIDR